jgi:hypothetical protein
MSTIGVISWFIILPLTPIYGILKPWPEAEANLRQNGIGGLPLMVGSAEHSENRGTPKEPKYLNEKQRSYIVIPESMQQLAVFTYVEVGGVKLIGPQQEIRNTPLFLLFGIWCAAGLFTFWRIRSLIRRNENH